MEWGWWWEDLTSFGTVEDSGQCACGLLPLSLLVSLSVFSLFSPCRLVQVEIVPGGEEAVATRSHYTALHPARIDLKLWAFRASEETTSPGGGWTSGWSRGKIGAGCCSRMVLCSVSLSTGWAGITSPTADLVVDLIPNPAAPSQVGNRRKGGKERGRVGGAGMGFLAR